MNCPSCGTANADGAAFCANCGTTMTPTGGGAAVATATDPGTNGGGVPPVNMTPTPSAPVEDELFLKTKEHLGHDYKIEKELGRGGMAVVYKGVEIALDRTVAIKVVPPESANAGQAAERFRREARLAASLDHANIIPVYRVGTAGPLHFMAMKFVEGRAVDAIIEAQGALPINVAIAILKYSAMGLAFAHEKKIVHRDIKGANILVDKDGRVMVSDFGIARALEEVSLTASGMVIGTPYFMSPEQCGGQKISPQSDQYSLGVMGFQMLTGEVPFNADSMVGIIQHHYMTPVPDITAVRSDVPPELLDIIYCSLNKAPEDRFATTRDMAQALENVPQTDEERAEAEALLKQLSAGEGIPKVRTGTLPPLALTISGAPAPVAARPATAPRARPATAPVGVAPVKKKKKKKKNKAVMFGAPVLLAAVLGGGIFAALQQKKAADAKAAEEQRKADALKIGNIVFTGNPTTLTVLYQGKLYQHGAAVPMDTGQGVFVSIRAPGYDNNDTTVHVVGGRTDTIDVTLKAAQSFGNNQQQQQQQQQQVNPNQTTRAAGPVTQTPVRVDSNDVLIRVTPPSGTIVIDGNVAGVGTFSGKAAVGTRNMTVTAAGCIKLDTTINVVKGAPLRLPIKLNCGG